MLKHHFNIIFYVNLLIYYLVLKKSTEEEECSLKKNIKLNVRVKKYSCMEI